MTQEYERTRRRNYLDEQHYARHKQRAMETPEAIHARSTVVVVDELGIETIYNIVTVRLATADGSAHFSFLEWQDGQSDEAFKVALPGKVVSKIANHIDSTNARNRSRVSRRHSNPNAFGNFQRPALDVDNPQHPFTVIGGGEEEQIS